MVDLRTLAALTTLALGGCAAPSLPPIVEAPPPRSIAPPPTAIDDWAGACGRSLDGARLISEGMIEAWRERDLVKLVCLDEKQKMVDGLLATMSDHLQRIACTTDENRLLHELTILQIACRKIDALRQEAFSCVGEELFSVAAR